jgi:hypothetical protein
LLKAEAEKVKGVEAQAQGLEALAKEMNINCDHETHCKEHLNDAKSERVLPPVLDDNESEVPDTTQADDGDRNVSGGPKRRASTAKKAKKKAKRKGTK